MGERGEEEKSRKGNWKTMTKAHFSTKTIKKELENIALESVRGQKLILPIAASRISKTKKKREKWKRKVMRKEKQERYEKKKKRITV